MALAPSSDKTIHSAVEEERTAALPEAAMLKTFREYARGRQRSTTTPGQAKILTGILGNLFCDNICKRVLQELRNRLRLARYSVSSATDDGKDPQLTYLKGLWTLNQLGALSAAVHWSMLRDGNHAVGLRWIDTSARVQLVREPFWNGESGIFIAYDGDNQPKYALKDWVEPDGTQRRTLWFPERIERYVQDGNGWQRRQLASDTDWPQPWEGRDGQPLGIPIVHFANLQLPADGPGTTPLLHMTVPPQSPPTNSSSTVTGLLSTEPDPRYGSSELDGGVVGLQDEINDLHRDISAAARFAGYQMVYGTGITIREDAEGNPITLDVEPGAFWEEPNPDARFGTLPPGSIASLKDGLDIKLQAVSRMTSVPNHLISGNWPSGSAILQIELPLIDKIETIAGSAGPAWSSVAHKAMVLQNTFGQSTKLDTEALITAVFLNATRRDPVALAAVAVQLLPILGEQETLEVLGYSPEDAKRIMKQKTAEAIANTPPPPPQPTPGTTGPAQPAPPVPARREPPAVPTSNGQQPGPQAKTST